MSTDNLYHFYCLDLHNYGNIKDVLYDFYISIVFNFSCNFAYNKWVDIYFEIIYYFDLKCNWVDLQSNNLLEFLYDQIDLHFNINYAYHLYGQYHLQQNHHF